LPPSAEAKRELLDWDPSRISSRRQCALLGISRSGCYHEPARECDENLALMRLIDEEFLRHPFYGRRRMREYLRGEGRSVNLKRVGRLMRLMGLEAIYPKPRLSVGRAKHRKFPYLMRGVSIDRVDQVWSADIPYVPMPKGFMYLAATIDGHSRKVLGWRLSNTLDGSFCNALLADCLTRGRPEVFNTDQGVQFTAEGFVSQLETAGVAISMDGKGRALDNVFVERRWRSVKYEDIYIRGYEDVRSLQRGLEAYFRFYNEVRRHQSLGYRCPAEVYGSRAGEAS
jgi:putative transposase